MPDDTPAVDAEFRPVHSLHPWDIARQHREDREAARARRERRPEPEQPDAATMVDRSASTNMIPSRRRGSARPLW